MYQPGGYFRDAFASTPLGAPLTYTPLDEVAPANACLGFVESSKSPSDVLSNTDTLIDGGGMDSASVGDSPGAASTSDSRTTSRARISHSCVTCTKYLAAA